MNFPEETPLDPSMLPGTTPAPSAPSLVAGGPSIQSKIRQILQVALPAIATAYAARKGAVGPLWEGIQGRQDLNAEREYRTSRDQADDQYRNTTLDYQRRRLEADAASQAAEDADRRDENERRMNQIIGQAIDNAAQNPAFFEMLNQQGAENFSITVPGIGNINLRDAFARIGVPQGPDGKYHYGKPPTPEKPDLKPVIGPNGKPVYGTPKPGDPVYERPRVPRASEKPTRRAYTWTDEDGASPTFGQSFRIIEDEDGKVISKKRITADEAPGSGAAPEQEYDWTPNGLVPRSN